MQVHTPAAPSFDASGGLHHHTQGSARAGRLLIGGATVFWEAPGSIRSPASGEPGAPGYTTPFNVKPASQTEATPWRTIAASGPLGLRPPGPARVPHACRNRPVGAVPAGHGRLLAIQTFILSAGAALHRGRHNRRCSCSQALGAPPPGSGYPHTAGHPPGSKSGLPPEHGSGTGADPHPRRGQLAGTRLESRRALNPKAELRPRETPAEAPDQARLDAR